MLFFSKVWLWIFCYFWLRPILYVEKGGLDDKVNKTFINFIQFIIEITALDMIRGHECKLVSTDIVEHSNLKVWSGHRLNIALVGQIKIVSPFGYDFWVHDTSLKVINGWNQWNQTEKFVNLDFQGVLLVDFAVGRVAIGTDDEEDVKGSVLPTHTFWLKNFWFLLYSNL